MSGDWLAFGAIGALVVAGAVRQRSGSRGAPALRLRPELQQTDEDLLGATFGMPGPMFDPDETGTPWPPQGGQASAVQVSRTCPFGHRQQKCGCDLRPGYWAQSKRPTELSFRQRWQGE